MIEAVRKYIDYRQATKPAITAPRFLGHFRIPAPEATRMVEHDISVKQVVSMVMLDITKVESFVPKHEDIDVTFNERVLKEYDGGKYYAPSGKPLDTMDTFDKWSSLVQFKMDLLLLHLTEALSHVELGVIPDDELLSKVDKSLEELSIVEEWVQKNQGHISELIKKEPFMHTIDPEFNKHAIYKNPISGKEHILRIVYCFKDATESSLAEGMISEIIGRAETDIIAAFAEFERLDSVGTDRTKIKRLLENILGIGRIDTAFDPKDLDRLLMDEVFKTLPGVSYYQEGKNPKETATDMRAWSDILRNFISSYLSTFRFIQVCKQRAIAIPQNASDRMERSVYRLKIIEEWIANNAEFMNKILEAAKAESTPPAASSGFIK